VKIAFVHFSDLFVATGTAVLFRRIMGELSETNEVCHIIPLRRSERTNAEIASLYHTNVGRVTAICLPLTTALRVYYRVSNWRFTQLSKRIPGVMFARSLKAALESLSPDLIWWSSDYLPDSLSTLYVLRRSIAKMVPLHLSVLDPPELFHGSSHKNLELLRLALSLSTSVSSIGVNLQHRLQQLTNKPVGIISDFIENELAEASGMRNIRSLRVGIAGRLYQFCEFERFLRHAAEAFEEVVINWYGAAERSYIPPELSLPPNVRINALPELAREAIAPVLRRDCDVCYMSMPSSMSEFARYSVPTKFVSYVEADVPVIFDAPPDSELQQLNSEYLFGVNLSVEENPLAALREIREKRGIFLAGLRRLRNERFSKSLVIARIERLLAETRDLRNAQVGSSEHAREMMLL
jgi:hypothetical protein